MELVKIQFIMPLQHQHEHHASVSCQWRLEFRCSPNQTTIGSYGSRVDIDSESMRQKNPGTITIASDWFISVKPLPCFHRLQIQTCHLMHNSIQLSTNTPATCNSISARTNCRDLPVGIIFTSTITHWNYTFVQCTNLTFRQTRGIWKVGFCNWRNVRFVL